jgi:hypothetical protein
MKRFKAIRLSTNRLELIAATLAHLSAELESPEHLATMLNARVSQGWPPGEYDWESGPEVIGWYGWYALRPGNLRFEIPRSTWSKKSLPQKTNLQGNDQR